MTTAATHEEIQKARAYIEEHGYQAGTNENGHLIVQDPHNGGAWASPHQGEANQ
ncbi:hypothetical protein NO430_21815 (plasmid) [Xanthomonas oryzae pv. oryzae]|uniref:hypothetical protein n=1 Tax=Xanthomonas oryzae TaxID=347 RepID=UPI00217D1514|nr:hypothetical protein [Xanthomonas oryzae]UWI58970.1 hypothetical protein NO430_21815 [Xanthomonas oryzae pv. oryzae]